jgi:hypothetical protein
MSWKKFQIDCQEDTLAWWQTEHNNTPLEVRSTCGGGCNGTRDWEEEQGFLFQQQGMIAAQLRLLVLTLPLLQPYLKEWICGCVCADYHPM